MRTLEDINAELEQVRQKLDRAWKLSAVMEDLSARYPREQVESILMHEVIHWLRLMPYKLNKDRKRAAMFYAGLVMVANDVADFSEHKKETLC